MRYTHDGSLEIVTPQMNHAGRYTCHVSNLAGDDHITYLLKVHEPPKIISDIAGLKFTLNKTNKIIFSYQLVN